MRLFRLVRGEQSLAEVDAVALRRAARLELAEEAA
jgi:aerotaxis receptor